MSVYKAFLKNEWTLYRKSLFWHVILFLLPIGAVLAPYLNQFNMSGIRYSQSDASLLAFVAMVTGITWFAGVATSQSSFFEKTEGMCPFLFSQDISKTVYVLAKLTIPLAATAAGSIIPSIIYYGFELYQTSVPLAILLIASFSAVSLWSLIGILTSLFFTDYMNIILIGSVVATAVATGIGYFLYYYTTLIIFLSILLVCIVLLLFNITITCLQKKEVTIIFERFK